MKKILILGKLFIMILLGFGIYHGSMPNWATYTVIGQQVIAILSVAVAYWAVRDDRKIIYEASQHKKEAVLLAIKRLLTFSNTRLAEYYVPMAIMAALLYFNGLYILVGLHVFGTLLCVYYRGIAIEVINLLKEASDA